MIKTFTGPSDTPTQLLTGDDVDQANRRTRVWTDSATISEIAPNGSKSSEIGRAREVAAPELDHIALKLAEIS